MTTKQFSSGVVEEVEGLVHFEMLRKLAGESDDTASVNAAS